MYNTRYLPENFDQCRLEKTILRQFPYNLSVRSSWNALIQDGGKYHEKAYWTRDWQFRWQICNQPAGFVVTVHAIAPSTGTQLLGRRCWIGIGNSQARSKDKFYTVAQLGVWSRIIDKWTMWQSYLFSRLNMTGEKCRSRFSYARTDDAVATVTVSRQRRISKFCIHNSGLPTWIWPSWSNWMELL